MLPQNEINYNKAVSYTHLDVYKRQVWFRGTTFSKMGSKGYASRKRLGTAVLEQQQEDYDT